MKFSRRAFLKWLGIASGSAVGMAGGWTEVGKARALASVGIDDHIDTLGEITPEELDRRIESAFFDPSKIKPAPGIWIGLLTHVGERDEDHVEVSGPGYVRQWIAPGGWNMETIEIDDLIHTRYSNVELIAFPKIPKDKPLNRGWGKVYGAGLFDAESDGHMLFYMTLPKPERLFIGNQIYFKAGTFGVTVEAGFVGLLGKPSEAMKLITRDEEN